MSEVPLHLSFLAKMDSSCRLNSWSLVYKGTQPSRKPRYSSLQVHGGCAWRAAVGRGVLFEKGVNLKLSGNEVYYTNTLLLVVKNMLRSKLHYQKVLM